MRACVCVCIYIYLYHNSSTLTFTGVDIVQRGRLPRLLNKPGTACMALFSASVVLAATDELEWVARVGHVADGCVTIADALAADGYVFDTVVVLQVQKLNR